MKYIILLLTILTIGCTKEVLVEVPVQNPVNTQLQSQITQLQNTISNLTSTNNNLESQISLLESEASLLEIDLENSTSDVEELMNRVILLEEHIEEYNIELERSQEDSFFRLNYSQTEGRNVLRVGSFVLSSLGRFDAEGNPNQLWFEDHYGIQDGKEMSFSSSGSWNNSNEIRAFYDRNGALVAILASYELTVDNIREQRTFFVEAYDYIYQFEDDIIEYMTIN